MVLITEFHSNSGPIFKPQFLGDKWQYIDFIIELVGAQTTTPFFFVQVKTTREGYTQKHRRLKVKIKSHQLQGIVSYPAPTYLIGIDEINERGYILSANEPHLKSLSTFSTKFPVNKQNREQLWNEVNDFWSGYDKFFLNSYFSETDEG
ncbi:MAG: DUF4365 domain-containing protein [Oscillatoriales cyanobacterium C42_A2020_001]|nr:DUF4365 domain-containing protein [Leptolyngbyaceae cyanobacterium C42_A2020_001]